MTPDLKNRIDALTPDAGLQHTPARDGRNEEFHALVRRSDMHAAFQAIARDREATLVLACKSAISWLDGWASAEPYVTILRNAISGAPGGAWNRMTPNTKPPDSQMIVKRWKNGSVWAGTFTGGAKNESFDWWLPLPPLDEDGAA